MGVVLKLHFEVRSRGLSAVEFNVYHETGFEMDLWHPGFQVNIELDGPSHRLRLIRDSERDRILTQHGVDVHRVSILGLSFPDVSGSVIAKLKAKSRD